MCAVCGCTNDHSHEHDHGHHEHHGHHAHAEGHHHAEPSVHSMDSLERRLLAKNDAFAAENRAWLTSRNILALNFVSSPGAGKTTLLERLIRDVGMRVPIFVIEGDQATEM